MYFTGILCSRLTVVSLVHNCDVERIQYFFCYKERSLKVLCLFVFVHLKSTLLKTFSNYSFKTTPDAQSDWIQSIGQHHKFISIQPPCPRIPTSMMPSPSSRRPTMFRHFSIRDGFEKCKTHKLPSRQINLPEVWLSAAPPQSPWGS
ncbi:hypothetical protein XENORESO_013411 [Xenotaenia resolanae]|uniref:Uncharacterized protein n=1 Tax=Xenotaenia resolanae TaxID=208358 RepID=A0ABV0X8H0_9TELE